MSDYIDEISAFICRCQFDDLPSTVIQRAGEVMADSLAVIGVGAQEEEVRAMTERIVVPGDRQAATLIGVDIRAQSLTAALINGTAGTFLELDEGNQFARGHAAVHVIPAALAKAEEMNLSGRELLTALILGYEIAARIGIACKIRMSMHPHGTWGTVGAAVAVGKLMGYEEKAMREIINVSSSLGLATSRRTMLEGGLVRNVYAGVSGYMGVLAHELVQSGFTGETDGLQTVFGTVVSDTFMPEKMTEDLGAGFEITRNYFKRHACCRYNHATLDTLGDIIAKAPGDGLKPDEVAKIEVKTYSLAAQLCDPNPQNTLAGKFSIPFAVATSVVNRSTGVESFTPQAIQNPVTRELAQRVIVSEDPEMTAMMPDHRPAKVKVTFTNGTVLEDQTLTNKGDFEDPYSPEELREKYYELAGLIWKREIAEAIYADAMNLEKLDNVNEMTARMRQTG
jgi:2-methylcitrate dehydratase PrpD